MVIKKGSRIEGSTRSDAFTRRGTWGDDARRRGNEGVKREKRRRGVVTTVWVVGL